MRRLKFEEEKERQLYIFLKIPNLHIFLQMICIGNIVYCQSVCPCVQDLAKIYCLEFY